MASLSSPPQDLAPLLRGPLTGPREDGAMNSRRPDNDQVPGTILIMSGQEATQHKNKKTKVVRSRRLPRKRPSSRVRLAGSRHPKSPRWISTLMLTWSPLRTLSDGTSLPRKDSAHLLRQFLGFVNRLSGLSIDVVGDERHHREGCGSPSESFSFQQVSVWLWGYSKHCPSRFDEESFSYDFRCSLVGR